MDRGGQPELIERGRMTLPLPDCEEDMSEEMVKVKIRPNRGIGGFGSQGDEVDMPLEMAKQYEAEGYLDILGPLPAPVNEDEPPADEGENSGPQEPAEEDAPEEAVHEEEQDHKIMKPESKRQGRARK